jgi:nitroreductase
MEFDTGYDVDFGRRDPAGGVSELFYRRWSPRSFCGTVIPLEVQRSIFDAARWAPSCFNEQPWLIVTSSGEEDFPVFLGLLAEGNRRWAVNASLLGFVFAKRRFDRNGKYNRWAQFDCGSAWMSIALQASLKGLYAHGMGGILGDLTYEALGVPEEDYEVVCGFALGAIDDPWKLPDDLADQEVPSARKPLDAIWRRGIGSSA